MNKEATHACVVVGHTAKWIKEDGFNESAAQLIEILDNIEEEGLNPKLYRFDFLENYYNKDSLSLEEKAIADIFLTNSFYLLATHFSNGVLEPESLEKEWLSTKKEIDIEEFLEKALQQQEVKSSLYSLFPQDERYHKLKNKLKLLREIKNGGGWIKVNSSQIMKIGSRGESIKDLKLRLKQSGDFSGEIDEEYDENLKESVINFQKRYGLILTGNVNKETRKMLNLSPRDIINKIIEDGEEEIESYIVTVSSDVEKGSSTIPIISDYIRASSGSGIKLETSSITTKVDQLSNRWSVRVQKDVNGNPVAAGGFGIGLDGETDKVNFNIIADEFGLYPTTDSNGDVLGNPKSIFAIDSTDDSIIYMDANEVQIWGGSDVGDDTSGSSWFQMNDNIKIHSGDGNLDIDTESGIYKFNGQILSEEFSLIGSNLTIDKNGISADQFDIYSDGSAEFRGKLTAATGDFEGKITATSGDITGTLVVRDELRIGYYGESSASVYTPTKNSYDDTSAGFYLGFDPSSNTATFGVGDGDNHLEFDGTDFYLKATGININSNTGNAEFSGELDAASGNFTNLHAVDGSISLESADYVSEGRADILLSGDSGSTLIGLYGAPDPFVILESSSASYRGISMSANDSGYVWIGTGESSTPNIVLDGSDGSIEANTKNFSIEHPSENMKNYKLKHSAVETPTEGDNIYRYVVNVENNNLKSAINLPNYFKDLNKNYQIFVTPQNHFGSGYGTIENNKLTIKTNQKGYYNILIIGTRKDKSAVESWEGAVVENKHKTDFNKINS